MVVLANVPNDFLLDGADEGMTPFVEVYDPETTVSVIAPTSEGITEIRPGTYSVSLTIPVVGNFRVRWTYTDPSNETIEAEEDVTVATTDVPEIRVDAIDTMIGTEAHDLLPETWDALAKAPSFGPNALLRRHDRVLNRIFGRVLTPEEQEVLPSVVIEYCGMRLAMNLIDPGIEYWSKQVLSRSVGERESASYKDRAEDLRLLKKQWTGDLASLWLDVQALIPPLPGRVTDAPVVATAGELTQTDANPRTGVQVAHTTANPYDIEPMYGPPETTA
jgi:hypothetical protein